MFTKYRRDRSQIPFKAECQTINLAQSQNNKNIIILLFQFKHLESAMTLPGFVISVLLTVRLDINIKLRPDNFVQSSLMRYFIHSTALLPVINHRCDNVLQLVISGEQLKLPFPQKRATYFIPRRERNQFVFAERPRH